MREILFVFVMCILVGMIAYRCGEDSHKSGYYDVHDKYKEINTGLHQRDSCLMALIDSAIYYFEDDDSRDFVMQCLEEAQYMIDYDDEYNVREGMREFEDLLHEAWWLD